MGNRLTERIARGGDKEKGKEKRGRKGQRKRGGGEAHPSLHKFLDPPLPNL